MDALIVAGSFLAGAAVGGFGAAIAYLVVRKQAPAATPAMVVAAPEPHTPVALYKPVDRSDKAVARMERLAKSAGDLPGTSTTFDMQVGPR